MASSNLQVSPHVGITDTELVRRIRWEPTPEGRNELAWKEWLVTNGLGGYASGTISGAVTRRYHGLLIAALPTPFGRTVMLNYVWEQLRFGDGRVVALPNVYTTTDGKGFDCSRYLAAFRLEALGKEGKAELEAYRRQSRT